MTNVIIFKILKIMPAFAIYNFLCEVFFIIEKKITNKVMISTILKPLLLCFQIRKDFYKHNKIFQDHEKLSWMSWFQNFKNHDVCNNIFIYLLKYFSRLKITKRLFIFIILNVFFNIENYWETVKNSLQKSWFLRY